MSQLAPLKRKYLEQGLTLPEPIQKMVLKYLRYENHVCAECHRFESLGEYNGKHRIFCQRCIDTKDSVQRYCYESDMLQEDWADTPNPEDYLVPSH